MKCIINLYPTAPNQWLWRDHDPETKRDFQPSISIREDDRPSWHECTDADKVTYEQEWDAAHPQEPVEPEESAES